MGQNNILKWISIPPVVAILVISLVRSLSDAAAAVPVHIAIWSFVWLLFIVLTVLYGLFIIHGFGEGLIPLQCLIQGMLICPLALSYGARMFQWVGVILAVCGAAALAVAYHQKQLEGVEQGGRLLEKTESHIPVPFVVTNDSGVVLNVSDALLEILEISSDQAIGKNISSVLNAGENGLEINGKFWDVTQKPMDGGRYYFQISEKKLPNSPTGPTIPGMPEDDEDDTDLFVDPETRLLKLSYAMRRLEEELYRAKRYAHPLTAALLRLVFPDEAEKDGSARAAFNAYCNVLSTSLRMSDTAALQGERTILLVLPECSKYSMEIVIQRLLTYINALCPSHPALYSVTALHVPVSYDGNDNIPGAGALVDRLSVSLNQKYLLSAG